MRSRIVPIFLAGIAVAALVIVLLWPRHGTGPATAGARDTPLAATEVRIVPARVKPGDPEIRVAAGPTARSVTVALPFDTVPRPAVRDPMTGVWSVRFLVPASYPDGLYDARVHIVRDDGLAEERSAAIRVDTVPASIAVLSPPGSVAPGAALSLRLEPALPFTRVRAAALHGGARGAIESALDVKQILVRAPWGEIAQAQRVGALGAWRAELHVPPEARPGPARLEIVAADGAGNVSRRDLDLSIAAAPVPGWITAIASALLVGLAGGMGMVLIAPRSRRRVSG